MFAGFLPLIFNPHAWVALGISMMVAFGGGYVKGWNGSSADQWRKVAVAAKAAAQEKERIADHDRLRADAAEADLAKLDATLEGVIRDANAKASTCRLSADELKRLQQLAGSGRLRR
jgi:hypothetical protein